MKSKSKFTIVLKFIYNRLDGNGQMAINNLDIKDNELCTNWTRIPESFIID